MVDRYVSGNPPFSLSVYFDQLTMRVWVEESKRKINSSFLHSEQVLRIMSCHAERHPYLHARIGVEAIIALLHSLLAALTDLHNRLSTERVVRIVTERRERRKSRE